jgi:hypothetical protein
MPAPGCAAKEHVQRDGADSLIYQVAIEEVSKVRANITWTAPLGASPRIVGSALELRHKVWLRARYVNTMKMTCFGEHSRRLHGKVAALSSLVSQLKLATRFWTHSK